MIDALRRTVAGLQADMVRWRRHLHQHPELSYHEADTVRYVIDRLKAEDIEVRGDVGRLSPEMPGTGAIAYVRGTKSPSDACVALRADLDALPIHEVGDKPYISRRPGVMHACGHDAHTAMLLGAGIALHRLRAQWSGTVMLVFQPGEEKGPGGAALLIKEGVFNDPKPAGIIGQHVTPELPVGTVAFRAGPFMAAADELHITVHGRGGHAAQRHALVDPVLIAARMIVALHEAVENALPTGQAGTPAGEPMVFSLGRVTADGATNVIPDQVYVAGTLRTFNETWRNDLHALITDTARRACREHGGDVEVRIGRGSPPVVNDAALTERVRLAAVQYLGAAHVVDADLRMGAEDFAWYTQVMPGCFHRLGTGHPDKPGTTAGLHRAEFDVDEDALVVGAGVMAWGAVQELAAVGLKSK
ncbi:MAG: M20 family metallopeptidase [Flavobacteriales bacterium]|jgi:amidohydrolase|nr:M20 family metallopeptidase [Flavobacteriales bacterium]